jgi:hypothetical protein
MRIDLTKEKTIFLNRATISLLGNPPHLSFRFDAPNERLIVLPAFEETLDTFEIQKHYWRSERSTCKICRLPLLLSLKRKFGWGNGKSYTVQGIFQVLESQKLVVFNLDEVVECTQSGA